MKFTIHNLRMIKARFSSNGWVLAELFLVFIVMWFLCDSLGCMKYTFYRPLGYNIEHVYKLSTVVGGESRDTSLTDADKYLGILAKLEQEPSVEAAALCYWSLPMSGSNSYNALVVQDTSWVQGRCIYTTGGYMDVFRISEDPRHPFRDTPAGWNNVTLSNAAFERFRKKMPEFSQTTPLGNGDSVTIIKQMGKTGAFRSYRYGVEEPWFFYHLGENMIKAEFADNWSQIVFRVKPAADGPDYREKFLREIAPKLDTDNAFVADAAPYTEQQLQFEVMNGDTDKVNSQAVVVLFLLVYLYTRAATYLEPRGFNIEHCYLIELGELTPKSPDYIAGHTSQQTHDDIAELLERLRRRPEIEAVSLSQNSYPYNGSNSGAEVSYDTLRSPGWTIRRLVTPDFPRVFRYRGTRGETPEQLAEMLERGEFMASDNLYRKYDCRMTDLVGQRFYLFGDTTKTYRLGAALQNVRYHDYDQARSSYSMMVKQSFYYIGLELCVRVREGQDNDFIERLKADSESQFRIGNIFISEIRSFKDIRRNYQQAWTNDIRNYVMGMGFLLLNIFLGLLGTFWFRTQQRRSEIALHKAHGATDRAIFSRLLSEGILLLAIVTPVALLIDYNLAHLELNSWRNGTTLEWDRLLLCAAISFVLITLMIVIGIGIPARKAMKVQPAEALHDE